MAQQESQATEQKAKSNTVKVRVKHGRVLLGRSAPKFGTSGVLIEESHDERYAEVGEIIEVERSWAERLLKREFDGYPSRNTNGSPGQDPGTIRDCPIEIVN